MTPGLLPSLPVQSREWRLGCEQSEESRGLAAHEAWLPMRPGWLDPVTGVCTAWLGAEGSDTAIVREGGRGPDLGGHSQPHTL